MELDGALETFDQRFREGHREGYGADLSSPALGSDRIPLLADVDARVGRIIGNTGYHINLGALTTDAFADVGTGFLGLSLGLTGPITVFGRIPLVRTRVQSVRRLSSAAADGGPNPGGISQNAFFGQFDAALTTLSNKLAAGDYDSNPSQKALAQATLADATAVRTDLFGLLADPTTASDVVPTASSPAGTAVDTRIAALQTTFSSLNVPGFTLTPALPSAPLTEAELDQYLTAPGGPIALRLDEAKITFRGDAEAGAALTLIDTWDRGRQRGGFRAAVSGLVRFPTGQRASPDRPLAIGTGDGQTDLQFDGVVDIGGGRLGARLSGTYVRQLPGNILARVTRPSQPFVGPDRLTLVRWDPGDIVSIGVHPFYRLARTIALQAGVEHWVRSTDHYSYPSPADSLLNIDPNIMAEESEANATMLSVGITYSNPGARTPGGTGWPVDARWSYDRILRAGGGRVPDTHRVSGQLRVYFGVW
ncbi:MAG TPA: hypothetical protein VGN76_12180 [Gemmatimonadales bacterium]|nr:hypothetical protein [Gemmatimonadales bacterium]